MLKYNKNAMDLYKKFLATVFFIQTWLCYKNVVEITHHFVLKYSFFNELVFDTINLVSLQVAKILLKLFFFRNLNTCCFWWVGEQFWKAEADTWTGSFIFLVKKMMKKVSKIFLFFFFVSTTIQEIIL